MTTTFTPGLHTLSNDEYHASPGISSSGLWTIHSRSPAHYRFQPPREATFFDVGTAAHDAILSPDGWESRHYRGPAKRTNSDDWKNAEEFARHNGLTILKPADYDAVLRIRDAALSVSILRQLLEEPGVSEVAGLAIDAETGAHIRCKPDRYVKSGGIVDIKTTTDARPEAFARAVRNYGYHVQEPVYTDVWQAAGGGHVEWFIFAVIEKREPFEVALYETTPNVQVEGHAIYRRALATYAACAINETYIRAIGHPDSAGVSASIRACWPGYPKTVQPLDFSKWAYSETTPEVE